MDEYETDRVTPTEEERAFRSRAHQWPAERRENVPDSIHAMLCRAVRESSAHGPDVAFDDDTQLLAEGIIDSIGIFSVMSEIEQELGCVVPPGEVTADNFRSIGALSALVARLAPQRNSGG